MFTNQTDVLNKFDVITSVLNSRVKNESKWVRFASVTKSKCLVSTRLKNMLIWCVWWIAIKMLLLHIDEVIIDDGSHTEARLFTRIILYL